LQSGVCDRQETLISKQAAAKPGRHVKCGEYLIAKFYCYSH
jgi:hypothetical protein